MMQELDGRWHDISAATEKTLEDHQVHDAVFVLIICRPDETGNGSTVSYLSNLDSAADVKQLVDATGARLGLEVTAEGAMH